MAGLIDVVLGDLSSSGPFPHYLKPQGVLALPCVSQHLPPHLSFCLCAFLCLQYCFPAFTSAPSWSFCDTLSASVHPAGAHRTLCILESFLKSCSSPPRGSGLLEHLGYPLLNEQTNYLSAGGMVATVLFFCFSVSSPCSKESLIPDELKRLDPILVK